MKIPTKLKLLIYHTVIRQTLLYGCETWPMSVKDEKRMTTTEMRMVRWATGVSLLEHRRNEEILEEVKVETIATVMRRRRLEWFGHVKMRGETENIRAVAEMKMEEKRPRGRSCDGNILSEGTWKPGKKGRMGHWPRKMERSLQEPLPRTVRRRRKVRKKIDELVTWHAAVFLWHSVSRQYRA